MHALAGPPPGSTMPPVFGLGLPVSFGSFGSFSSFGAAAAAAAAAAGMPGALGTAPPVARRSSSGDSLVGESGTGESGTDVSHRPASLLEMAVNGAVAASGSAVAASGSAVTGAFEAAAAAAAPGAVLGVPSPPLMAALSPWDWAAGEGGEGIAAAVAAEWERPLGDNPEDLCLMLSSPARPSTPSYPHGAPYPLRHPSASPLHSPAHTPGAYHPFAMLRIPPPSPHRGPSPRGEQRALVEWSLSLAAARHASPAWRAASPAWRAASPHLSSIACASPLIGSIGSTGTNAAAAGAGAGSSTIYWARDPSAAASAAPTAAPTATPPSAVPSAGVPAGLPASILMPPGFPLERMGSGGLGSYPGLPLSRADSGGGFGAADGFDAARRSPWIVHERPSTDPRSSPAWSLGSGHNLGHNLLSGFGYGSMCGARPMTAPALPGGAPQPSPRLPGVMLPPPPRCKAADAAEGGGGSAASLLPTPPPLSADSTTTLTDDDIESFLEPASNLGNLGLSLQYGSMKDLADMAANVPPPRSSSSGGSSATSEGATSGVHSHVHSGDAKPMISDKSPPVRPSAPPPLAPPSLAPLPAGPSAPPPLALRSVSTEETAASLGPLLPQPTETPTPTPATTTPTATATTATATATATTATAAPAGPSAAGTVTGSEGGGCAAACPER